MGGERGGPDGPVRDVKELPPSLRGVLAGFRSGTRIGLARAISVVEDERPGFEALLHAALGEPPRARRIGLTGPPGAGKSSLLATLAAAYRERDEQVGIVAVDPTSPFSGGALLGDRIRMNDVAIDPGIFIRSMATRGSLGGLATSTHEVVDLMDAFGFERLLLETVGVGQTELEITQAADTVVVVLVPESGDAIQAMKAGLMEIADVFVVNKADRPGADRLVRELDMALHLRTGEPLAPGGGHHGVDLARAARGSGRHRPAPGNDSAPAGPHPVTTSSVDGGGGAWRIPVLRTVAQTGEGVSELLNALDRHGAHLKRSGALEARRRARTEMRIREVVERNLRRLAWSSTDVRSRLERGLDEVERGFETPYSVARALVEALLGTP